MRIIAGTLRGRKVMAPKGDTTRPTTDRVREALMSSLESYHGSLEGCVVLDAFAGSGVLSFELISRGAKESFLFDKDPKACAVIKQNAKELGVLSAITLQKQDIFSRPPLKVPYPFDVIVLDPPYATSGKVIADLLIQLQQAGSIAPDCIICYEHAKKTLKQVQEVFQEKGFVPFRYKGYGDIILDYYLCS